jgi:hypothetical protein
MPPGFGSWTSGHRVGRVAALCSMAFVGSTPIGAPIVGALSDIAGARYPLALGAAACLAAVAVGRWSANTANGPRIARQTSSPDP